MALLKIRKEWIETEPKIIEVIKDYFDYTKLYISYSDGHKQYIVNNKDTPDDYIEIGVTFRYNENQELEVYSWFNLKEMIVL